MSYSGYEKNVGQVPRSEKKLMYNVLASMLSVETLRKLHGRIMSDVKSNGV